MICCSYTKQHWSLNDLVGVKKEDSANKPLSTSPSDWLSLEDRLQVTAHAQNLTLYTSFEGRGCFRKRELKGDIQFDYVYLVLRTRERFEAMGSRLSRPQPIEVQNENALTSADVRAYFPRTNVFFV